MNGNNASRADGGAKAGSAADGRSRDVKTVLRRLGPVGPLALIAASLPAIGGFVLLGTLTWFAPWLRSHGELGIVLYILGFAVLAGLAVLPTYDEFRVSFVPSLLTLPAFRYCESSVNRYACPLRVFQHCADPRDKQATL